MTPGELKAALNVIGKRMLLTQKKAVLVIEDLSFTIERLAESLQISSCKAKKIIFLLLENLRKYDVKVIVVMHDIDADIVVKCDFKVFFQVPLTTYKAKVYSALFSLDMTEIKTLPQYQYVCKGRTETQRGTVTALESHAAIEKDKSFMVKEMLGKCRSLVEKVLVLRLHLEMANSEIAKTLNLELHTVENLVYKIRKRGIAISDARRNFRLENLAF